MAATKYFTLTELAAALNADDDLPITASINDDGELVLTPDDSDATVISVLDADGDEIYADTVPGSV